MKFSCTQENLNKGLQIASNIASKNTSLPILNNVLLKIEENNISLLSTNLEIGVKCTIRGKIESNGSLTLPARLFADYINSLPKQKIDFSEDDQTLEVTCGNFETKLRGIDSSEFPLIPEIENGVMYTLNIDEFKEAVGQVIFSVSTNEIRPEISGVYLSFNNENKKLTIASTDSYRLAEKNIAFNSESGEKKEVIVPAKTMQELLRILSLFKEVNDPEASNEIKVFLTENQIMFSVDGVELISRVVEGQYPDYRQIIPSEHKTKTIFNKNELAKAVRTASLFSKPGIYDINFSFKNNELSIDSSNTQFGENTIKISTETEGEENEIVLNYKYLLEGLNAINTNEVIFELVSGDNPCLIKPKEEDDYLYIIMPIKK